jgi:hypothetical protein
MFIYNTTFHCEKECQREFLTWLRTEYIPVAIQHKDVSEPRLAHILGQSEEEGISISLQFLTPSLNALSAWYKECGAALIEQLEKKFEKRVVGFSTIM